VSLLPEPELQAVEAWFSDLKDALGVSRNADRGRVLASVKKLVADNDTYDQEKRVVAAACGYKRWGDCYAWANSKLEATPEVELPEVFSKPPNGVVFRPGGDYDKAQKRLVKTRLRLKEVWAEVEAELAADPTCADWAAEQKEFFVREFEATTDFDEFDQTCLAFVRNYEGEEDPTKAWVEVADEAAAVFERNYDLPPGLTAELVTYAEEVGVEATKKGLGEARQLNYPAGYWLNYLLTAYLNETKRPEREEVWEVSDLFLRATELWGCYKVVSANDPDHPSFTKRDYDPTVTLAQVAAAVKKLAYLKDKDLTGTTEDWTEEVKAAVAALNGEKGVTATA